MGFDPHFDETPPGSPRPLISTEGGCAIGAGLALCSCCYFAAAQPDVALRIGTGAGFVVLGVFWIACSRFFLFGAR
jgi:enoyl-CoA hydratase/carnithine racemase